jgi:hypothetical protein
MIPCPVCETPNPPGAPECATCGRTFVVQAVGDAPAGTLADLDLGRIDSSGIAVNEPAIADLDLARAAPVNVVADVTPDLELGRSAPVNVVADATPDVEQTAVATKEWTPEAEGPPVCRACGTPHTDPNSVFCANCGRRVPVRAALTGIILDAVPVGDPDEKVKCHACGARVQLAEMCSDCGMPMRRGA